MAISTQTFSQYVSNAVAAIQAAATALIDLTIGSVLLAVVEANAAMALWLQGLALQIAALTRFASSFGPDADSWAADYGFARLDPVFAIGAVTFSRFTATNQASIAAATVSGTDKNGLPIYVGGTLVQTADGTQSFQVIPDASQPTYSAALNAYIIPAGTLTATASIQSLNATAAANVAPGAVSILAQSIPFVDTVSNASATVDGADAESDQAFKARFPLYLQSLTEGTKTACENAVKNLQLGATCTITENFNLAGDPQQGYFIAAVDDGSGNPSDAFLLAATAAIDAVRAEGTTFSVVRPTILTANIAMTVEIGAGFSGGSVRAAVSASISSYVNSLTEGAKLPYNILSSLAFSIPGVTNATAITLNGGTADFVSTGQQLIRTGTVTVS